MSAAQLRQRALRWLSQREHSRTELRARLMRLPAGPPGKAGQAAAAQGDGMPVDAGFADVGAFGDGGLDASVASTLPADVATKAALVDTVLDQLQTAGYLSDARFIESRVHTRRAAWGERRIQHELQQHGLALDAHGQQQLRQTEAQRAHALWQRRFGGQVAGDPAERLRQMRFLAGRGFSTAAIRHAVGGRGLDDETFSDIDTGLGLGVGVDPAD